MKALNLNEIINVVEKLQTLVGGRLQELRSGETWCELSFYSDRDIHPVLIDLSPQAPLLLPLAAPQSWIAKRTPVALFINAHLRDKHLTSVQVLRDRGRVVEFVFENEGRIEVRLYPRGQNLIAFSGDKKISYAKVLDESQPMTVTLGEARSVDEICSEFVQQNLQKSGVAPAPKTAEAQREKALQKKLNAREKMAKELEAKRQSPLREIGHWLKTYQTLNVKEEWLEYVDLRKSFAENLQDVFTAAKELTAKIARAEERLQIVDAEIAALRSTDVSASMNKPAAKPNQKNSILHQANARGRTIDLTSGHRLFVGRSGDDNLRILRAASSWDYWLHLKDEPGSHAILRRQKNEKITDAIFLESLKHLVKATYGEKAVRHEGEKFEGLVAECRYVKPIKGDRVGRVNYQNERVFIFTFKA
jgi:predicted ribosome quality control (RQC) complex YloA/Tae2 family protein